MCNETKLNGTTFKQIYINICSKISFRFAEFFKRTFAEKKTNMALAKRNRKILFRGNHTEQPARLLSSLSEFLLFYLYFCLLTGSYLRCTRPFPSYTDPDTSCVFVFLLYNYISNLFYSDYLRSSHAQQRPLSCHTCSTFKHAQQRPLSCPTCTTFSHSCLFIVRYLSMCLAVGKEIYLLILFWFFGS